MISISGAERRQPQTPSHHQATPARRSTTTPPQEPPPQWKSHAPHSNPAGCCGHHRLSFYTPHAPSKFDRIRTKPLQARWNMDRLFTRPLRPRRRSGRGAEIRSGQPSVPTCSKRFAITVRNRSRAVNDLLRQGSTGLHAASTAAAPARTADEHWHRRTESHWTQMRCVSGHCWIGSGACSPRPAALDPITGERVRASQRSRHHHEPHARRDDPHRGEAAKRPQVAYPPQDEDRLRPCPRRPTPKSSPTRKTRPAQLSCTAPSPGSLPMASTSGAY
jgi:hypothetical protein